MIDCQEDYFSAKECKLTLRKDGSATNSFSCFRIDLLTAVGLKSKLDPISTISPDDEDWLSAFPFASS